jgi:PleD family two-component response regulator
MASREAIASLRLKETSVQSNTPCRDPEFDRRRGVDSSRVLIVGADHSVCDDIAGFIRTLGGIETQCAYSADVAVRVATELLPGFVFLDSDSLAIDCYRLASVLHQHAGLHEARIIGLTREIATVDRQAALSAGFEQFLTLPLRRAPLEAVLTCKTHRGLERHRPRLQPD